MNSNFRRDPPSNNLNSLFQFKNISPRAQKHLLQVYLNLATGLLFAALGSLIHSQGIVQGGLVSALGATSLALGVQFTSQANRWRLPMFYGFTFLDGLTLGPLMQVAMSVRPGTVTSAFIATALVFASFSYSALRTNRRSFLFLGGILGSLVSVILISSIANLFLGSSLLFSAELYLGLFAFIGYVLYDTQLIVERAESGSTDTVRHSMDLFIDFVAIFVRLVIIMMRNQTQDNKKKRR